MSNIASIFIFVLSAFTFFFLYFRIIKKIYPLNVVFGSGLIIILSSVSLGLLFQFLFSFVFLESSVFNPKGLWYWGMFSGLFVGAAVATKKYELDFADLVLQTGLPFFVSTMLLTLEPIYPLIAVVTFYYLLRRYKKFTFSSLVGFGTYFAARTIVAIGMPHMLAFTSLGKIDIVLSSAVSFLFFFSVYNTNSYGRRK